MFYTKVLETKYIFHCL